MDTLATLLEKLETSLESVNKHLKMIKDGNCLTAKNYCCIFPETLLSITVSDNGYSIVPDIFPSQFGKKDAETICENIRNGRNEHPIVIDHVTYYEQRKQSLTDLINMF